MVCSSVTGSALLWLPLDERCEKRMTTAPSLIGQSARFKDRPVVRAHR